MSPDAAAASFGGSAASFSSIGVSSGTSAASIFSSVSASAVSSVSEGRPSVACAASIFSSFWADTSVWSSALSSDASSAVPSRYSSTALTMVSSIADALEDVTFSVASSASIPMTVSVSGTSSAAKETAGTIWKTVAAARSTTTAL